MSWNTLNFLGNKIKFCVFRTKIRVTKNAVNLFDTIDEKKIIFESYISSDIYALSFKSNNETIQYRNQEAQESPPLSNNSNNFDQISFMVSKQNI